MTSRLANAQGRWRRLLFALAVVAGTLSGGPRPVLAQEAEKPAAAARDLGAQQPAPENKNAILHYIWIAGLIGAFLVLLSMYFVATTIRLFLELRPQIAAPPELVGEVDGLLEGRQFKEVFAAVDGDNSFFGRTVATGIRELPNGLAEARDSMERVGESITAEMEKKISILAVLGTLGPMIGLLGTLKGMIASFGAIATSGVQMKADQVALGISEALILTFMGVGLSVPAIYFYAVFRNRVMAISIGTMLQADEFLRRFAHLARSKAPAKA